VGGAELSEVDPDAAGALDRDAPRVGRPHGARDQAKTITDRLGLTRNYWSATENERKILSAEKLAHLLDLLEFNNGEQAELLGLREAARCRGWWAGYSALFSYEILRYIGLEHGA
jgi:transcriptional regulator with XRE-family HTH domain